MSDPVLDLIQAKRLNYTSSGRDYLIKCLNPEHEDSNPSFRVDKSTGIAHCFACGFKTNLFTHFGIVANFVSIKVRKLKDKLVKLQINNTGLDVIPGSKPWTKDFRGISSKTLKHFEAFEVPAPKEEKLKDRIIFPIKDIRDKTVVYVGRLIDSHGNPRYLNYPSNAEVPLYPQKFDRHYKSLILVEGVFDMLNLYNRGIHNVVATFGTTKLYSDTADKLFTYKVQGVSKIYILFDGDKAGREAAARTKPLIEQAEFDCEILEMEDDCDPGDMSQEEVDILKRYINEGSNH